MKIKWGSDTGLSYKRLMERVQAKALRYDAFDETATREDYERLKKELTAGVVSDEPFDEGDGLVDFVVAKDKDHLARHESER